jgi:hypothetical protein
VQCASLQGLKHVQVGPRNLWSVFFFAKHLWHNIVLLDFYLWVQAT